MAVETEGTRGEDVMVVKVELVVAKVEVVVVEVGLVVVDIEWML